MNEEENNVDEEVIEVEEELLDMDNVENDSTIENEVIDEEPTIEENKKQAVKDESEFENKPVPYATFDKKTIIIIVIILIVLYGLYAYFEYFQ